MRGSLLGELVPIPYESSHRHHGTLLYVDVLLSHFSPMSFTSEQSILIFIVLVLSILLLWIVSINKRRRVAKQIIKASGNSITTTIIDRQVRVSLRRESILSDPQFRYICKDFNTEILYKSEWATEEYSPGNTVSVYIDPAKSDIYFVDLKVYILDQAPISKQSRKSSQ